MDVGALSFLVGSTKWNDLNPNTIGPEVKRVAYMVIDLAHEKWFVLC